LTQVLAEIRRRERRQSRRGQVNMIGKKEMMSVYREGKHLICIKILQIIVILLP
jgi:hypothetical protein